MMARRALGLGCLALCLAATGVSAQNGVQQFESSTQRVRVVELFTSHGCSSCPPADAWLRRLEDTPGLWRQVVPLAFHVDYWDYLGWRDRFADAGFSQRQRDYRRSGALGSVYTPGMLVNGREWRGWYRGNSIPGGQPVQIGRLQLEIAAEGTATLRFLPGPDWQAGELRAHIAILGNGVKSHIGAGENRGRELQESFVVLSHAETAETTAALTWQLKRPAYEPVEAGRLAVVAWLSAAKDPTPLQAVGGWLEEPVD